jgi:hypothetical protein
LSERADWSLQLVVEHPVFGGPGCGHFANVQLCAIETEVAVARLESIAAIDLTARMEAVSISTFHFGSWQYQ